LTPSTELTPTDSEKHNALVEAILLLSFAANIGDMTKRVCTNNADRRGAMKRMRKSNVVFVVVAAYFFCLYHGYGTKGFRETYGWPFAYATGRDGDSPLSIW